MLSTDKEKERAEYKAVFSSEDNQKLSSNDVQKCSVKMFDIASALFDEYSKPKSKEFEMRFNRALSQLTLYHANPKTTNEQVNKISFVIDLFDIFIKSETNKSVKAYTDNVEKIFESIKFQEERAEFEDLQKYKIGEHLKEILPEENISDAFEKKIRIAFKKAFGEKGTQEKNAFALFYYMHRIEIRWGESRYTAASHVLEIFRLFFADHFFVEMEHYEREKQSQDILSLHEMIEPFPFTMEKLIKSQILKQRRVQAVILCSFEGDESLYVSNKKRFPLLTKILATKGGALQEEMLLKLKALNYKAIQNVIHNLPRLTEILHSSTPPHPELTHKQIVELQICELLFYIEIPRWPAALAHIAMYLNIARTHKGYVELSDLPMSQPEVLGKVIMSLRGKIKHEWIYDYRLGSNFEEKFLHDEALTGDAIYHRIYFQGAELRLFILWDMLSHPFHEYDMKSIEIKFLIEIWPALFELFKAQKEDTVFEDEESTQTNPSNTNNTTNSTSPNTDTGVTKSTNSKTGQNDPPHNPNSMTDQDEKIKFDIQRDLGKVIITLQDKEPYKENAILQQIIAVFFKDRTQNQDRLREALIIWFVPLLKQLSQSCFERIGFQNSSLTDAIQNLLNPFKQLRESKLFTPSKKERKKGTEEEERQFQNYLAEEEDEDFM